MNNGELLEKAIAIAAEAHRGQKDRSGGPYILHPLRVMAGVQSITEKIVAILHDVVEDSDWTLDRLCAEGFTPEIIQAVDCVTKRDGEDYEAFVNRTATNPLAIRVKLADLQDNMDIRRLPAIVEDDLPRFRKYLAAWNKLRAIRGEGL